MAAGLSVVGKTNIFIQSEVENDFAACEALVDRAMGPGRMRKSLERLRFGRLPSLDRLIRPAKVLQLPLKWINAPERRASGALNGQWRDVRKRCRCRR